MTRGYLSALTRIAFIPMLLVAFWGCSDIVGVAAKDSDNIAIQPVLVGLDASVALSNTQLQDNVSLRVRSSYLRNGEQQILMTTQSMTLTAEGVQDVALPLEIAGCLADKNRTSSDNSSGVCRVMMALTLVINGVDIDEQMIGPIALRPGGQVRVQEPITLQVIDRIDVADAQGRAIASDSTLAVAANQSFPLIATILDDKGRRVSNRAVRWESSDTQVATVDNDGKVTAVSTGSATIRASAMSAHATVSVEVAPQTAALSVTAFQGSGSGIVTSLPAGIDCRIEGVVVTGSCSFTFERGTQIVLTSTADQGSVFRAWSDACATSSANVCVVTVNDALTTGLSFTAMRTVSVSAHNGDGRGRITGDGIDCDLDGDSTSGSCAVTVPEGTIVTLNAVAQPQEGSTASHSWKGWGDEGGVCMEQSATTCTVVASGGAKAVSAAFNAPRELRVVLAGSGAGVVSASEFSCERSGGATTGACSASYVHGSTVVLTAAAAEHSSFAGWVGVGGNACAGVTGNECTVAMDAAKGVSAQFEKRTARVSLTITGDGSGMVSVNGEQFCSHLASGEATTCSVELDAGTALTIAASPSENSLFSGFGGDCNGGAICSVVVTEDMDVLASFTVRQAFYHISGMAGAASSGRITGTGAASGIDCYVSGGSTTGVCSFAALQFAEFTLTAHANASSILMSWGGLCSNAQTVECALTSTAAGGTISTSFAPAVNVRMNLSGDAPARVLFDVANVPQQLPCIANGFEPVVCRFAVPSVPTVTSGTFRAEVGGGISFYGFTGACSNVGSPPFNNCIFSAVGFARDVYAVFSKY